jgi:Putative transposase
LISAFEAGQLQFFAALEPLRDRVTFLQYLAPVRETEWVVYAKRPFAGPEQVLDYVGRYTHRVALSNNRLLDIADGQVSFRYKDYRHDAQQKTMTLAAEEFIRRFLLHVLPAGFQRIRYYGFLGNRYRKEKLARCRQLLGMPAYEAQEPAKEAAAVPDYRERYEALTGVSLRRCPVCHQGCMQGNRDLTAQPMQPIDGHHGHLMRTRTVGDGRLKGGGSAWPSRAGGAVLSEGCCRSVFEARRRPVDPLRSRRSCRHFPRICRSLIRSSRFGCTLPPRASTNPHSSARPAAV